MIRSSAIVLCNAPIAPEGPVYSTEGSLRLSCERALPEPFRILIELRAMTVDRGLVSREPAGGCRRSNGYALPLPG